ncbi:hypothetical protein [Winogradskyella arenosi]|uniref:Uncharacterized protein n=1 Tax=Winogradskyella arenosi TaxID=533325 RepID=A0A368ZIX6_9FLAO|nr:hypothetical protein [Winogradskyella arenosi]RCW91321.1 hypothetical protein DFQ08_103148 [Winogradskyella arenosi]
MKTKLLIITLLFFITSNAQKFSQSINPKIFKNLKHNDKSGKEANIEFTHDYIIEVSITDYKYYQVDLISSNDQTESFTLYPLSLDLFETKFKNHFSKLVLKAEGENVTSDSGYDSLQISTLFARLVTAERTEEDKPIVAKIKLKKNIPFVLPINNDDDDDDDDDDPRVTGIVSDCKLELTFYNGFIEKVELEGIVKERRVRFTNTHSIGISSSNGIKRFDEHTIFSFFEYKWENNGLKRDSSGKFIEINFADIIDYDREIDINANDISPKPTLLKLDLVQDSTVLYKEDSTKLFEAIVFSDFMGVFDEENPNGIIQTELSKKFYINTDRKSVSNVANWLLLPIYPPAFFAEGIGVLEYLDVKVKLSKIEENNKFLARDTLGGDLFYQPLKIIQYETFSIGADLNLIYLENQNKKVNTNLDIGLRYGRSGLELNEVETDFFNTISTSLLLNLEFKPEKRYGFNASNRVTYFEIYNDDALTINSIHNEELINMKHWYNTSKLEFYVNTSNTGKLFIRYIFITQLDDWDNNFSQFQFGYSFFILRQNGSLN